MPIDILFGADCLGNKALAISANLVVQRQLNEKTMDIVVAVELVNRGEYAFDVRLVVEDEMLKSDACFGGSLGLHTDIGG
jgi:phenylpyruvate tautomerase PptA (4-oxalocrotonate tautomerase family)